jgi:hypothetical protein
LKLILKVFGVLSDRQGGAVSGHVQGVHDPCPGAGDIGSHVGSRGLHIPAKALDQDPGPRQIVSDMK